MERRRSVGRRADGRVKSIAMIGCEDARLAESCTCVLVAVLNHGRLLDGKGE